MIVDISMEGKSGLELQEELRSMGSDLITLKTITSNQRRRK